MALISFSNNTRQSWESGILDHRLKTVLRDIAFEFGGIWLTCIDRSVEHNAAVGGVNSSRHLLNAQGKCEAADFVLMNPALNSGVEDYARRHFSGLFVLFHDVNSGLHFHLHIKDKIELLA